LELLWIFFLLFLPDLSGEGLFLGGKPRVRLGEDLARFVLGPLGELIIESLLLLFILFEGKITFKGGSF
jgi:hypothetical protein